LINIVLPHVWSRHSYLLNRKKCWVGMRLNPQEETVVFRSMTRKSIHLAFVLFLSLNAWAASSFQFVQLADPQLGRGGYLADVARLEQAVRQINEQGSDFVLICGDLVDVTENAAGYVELLDVVKRLNCPVHMIPGNHDVGAPPNAKALAQYRKTIGDDYFSFEHKGWTFLGVDTQLWYDDILPNETASQQQWLTSSLQKVERGKIVIFGHYPLYKITPDEADDYYNIPWELRKQLLGLLEQYGVKAYLSGHTHARIINDYQGIQLVTAVSTSLNRDDSPYGYHLWTVGVDGMLSHKFVELEDGSWNAGPTVAVEVRGLKPGESSQVALFMGDRNNDEWDFDSFRTAECKIISKNSFNNEAPIDLKLLEEGEATAVVGAYHLKDGKPERLRFNSKRFTALLGKDNKVVIEFKDEKNGDLQ